MVVSFTNDIGTNNVTESIIVDTKTAVMTTTQKEVLTFKETPRYDHMTNRYPI